MGSFVGLKHDKQWIWLALDSDSREIVGMHIGSRDRAGAEALWKSLPPVYRQCAVCYTDFWSAYEQILPQNRRIKHYPENAACLLIQRVFLRGNHKKPLLNFVLQFTGKPSRLLIVIRIPLEVMLRPGIELGVDRARATTHPFHHCRPEGCLAIFRGSRKVRRNIERGKQANIGYRLINGRKYSVPVSLMGITAGLRALEKAAKGKRSGN